MRISDWSSDVCSSDLALRVTRGRARNGLARAGFIAAQSSLSPLNCKGPTAGRGSESGCSPGATPLTSPDRKSVVLGKSVSVRVDLVGRRLITKQTPQTSYFASSTHLLHTISLN